MGLSIVKHQTTQVQKTEQKDGQDVPVVVDGKPVMIEQNVVGDDGKEVVLYTIEVPAEVEAEGPEAVEAFVTKETEKHEAALAAGEPLSGSGEGEPARVDVPSILNAE